MPCIRCTGTVHLIHLVQFTLIADYFSHICIEVPGLEHKDQKFRDNLKKWDTPNYRAATRVSCIGNNSSVSWTKGKQKPTSAHRQAGFRASRKLQLERAPSSDAMYSEGKASSLISPLEKKIQTTEVTITKEDQLSLEGSGTWFLLRIAIKKCHTRWKGVQPLP